MDEATSVGLCPAHGAMEDALTEVRDAVGQIFGLLREQTEVSAKQGTQIAVLRTEVRGEFKNMKLTASASTNQQKKENAEVNAALARIEAELAKRKWGPQHTIALISSLLGSGGFIAILALIIQGGA